MDYVFKRFGKDHVALCGSYSTFKHDSTIRELGKVFGLPEEEIKALQRTNHAQDNIQSADFKIWQICCMAFQTYMSIHPCGMLITEEKITNLCYLFYAAKRIC